MAVFSTTDAAYSAANVAMITSLTAPNGQVLTFNYNLYNHPRMGNSDYAYLLQSVTSNLGYQIEYEYAGELPTAIIGINRAVNYCNPTAATSCTGLTVTWPQVALNYGTSISATNATGTATDALGRVTTYTTAPSTTQTLKRPSGLTLTIGYNSAGKVTSFSNGTGTWTYAYSVSGTTETTTVTDPLGHTRKVVSNLSIDKVTSDTDALGNTTTYAYDNYGRLTQVTYPEGNYTQYVYDNGSSFVRGNITQTTMVAKPGSGLANIVTSASYDATCTYAVKCNQPNSTTDALGNVTSYTYSTVHGGVLTVTKPAVNGVAPVIAYSYAQVATYALNSSGTLVQAGSIWEPTETATCATSAATVTATTTTASLSCAAGASDMVTTSISYAGSNNALPTSVTQGNGSVSATTSIAYDNFGNVVSQTNPLGAVTTNIYDADRELVASVAPPPQLNASGTVKSRAAYVTYNADGLPLLVERGTVPGPSGLTASNFASNFTLLQEDSISYDGLDRKIEDALISGGSTQAVTQYSYDNANRLTCTAVRLNAAVFGSLPASACTLGTAGSDGNDRITYNTYDNDNRVTQVTQGYGTGSPVNARTVTYSPNGNLLTGADANGNLTTDIYDGFDRLSKVEYPTPSNGAVSSTTDYEQYAYDADSRLTQDRRRDGQTNTLTYDVLNRLTATTLPSASSYGYDNLSRLTSATRNGQTLSYGYDALSRQTSEGGANGTFGYQYDVAGDLTQITWPDGFYANYVYDADGEVTQIEENGATSGVGLLAQYTYNDLGERLAVTRGDGVTTSYGYDAAWRLNSLAHSFPSSGNNQTVTLGYSAASQINARGSSNSAYNWTPAATSTSYGVNGQNQLTAAGSNALSYDGRGNLSSDSVNSYSYDSDNNLTAFNGSATLSTDALGRLTSVTDLSGGAATTASQGFRYGGSQLLAEYGTVGSQAGVLQQRYVPGPGTDETVVWYVGSTTTQRRWLATDERGSVTTVADVNGNVLAVNTYDDYGVPNASSNLGRFQYTGQMWIPEMGLYHYKARDYSPTLGRFLQTDPIGYGDGMNWYQYAHGDPINGTDPSGTETDQPDPNDPDNGGGGGSGGGSSTNPVSDCCITVKGPPYIPPSWPITLSDIFGSALVPSIAAIPGPPTIVVTAKKKPAPQSTQPSPSSNRAAACAAQVAKNDLAGSTLDAASIIPGGGDLADVARLGAGAASLGISVSQGNKFGTAIGATGTALGGVVVARNTVNAAAVGVKDGLEAVPGIGTVVGLGALAFDAYSAVDDYNKCMSGH